MNNLELKTQLEQFVNQGLTKQEIANKYGISVSTLYKWFKTLNIQYTIKTQLNVFINPTSDLGNKIVELRKQGKSFNEIKNILNCSKGTISYYCSPNQKDKIAIRKTKYAWKNSFFHRVAAFKSRIYKIPSRKILKDWNLKIRLATSGFKHKFDHNIMTKYTYKDVIDHIGGLKTKCYLTGRPIDITVDDYALDHIIPASKGGSNELDNLGITCPIVNLSKSNMTVEEYLALCKEVLEYNGYKVEKIKN